AEALHRAFATLSHTLEEILQAAPEEASLIVAALETLEAKAKEVTDAALHVVRILVLQILGGLDDYFIWALKKYFIGSHTENKLKEAMEKKISDASQVKIGDLMMK
ncbi:hypothetical protein ACJX0J_021105, partial [Zea mays]